MKNPIEIWRGHKSPVHQLQSEIQRLQSRMESFIDDLAPLSFEPFDHKLGVTPKCDVTEDKNNYYFRFDMPGITKDQVKIELVENTLTISAERKDEVKKEGTRSFFSEVSYGSYLRSFTLPGGADEKSIDAHLENGVLALIVRKTAPTVAKQIAIH